MQRNGCMLIPCRHRCVAVPATWGGWYCCSNVRQAVIDARKRCGLNHDLTAMASLRDRPRRLLTAQTLSVSQQHHGKLDMYGGPVQLCTTQHTDLTVSRPGFCLEIGRHSPSLLERVGQS